MKNQIICSALRTLSGRIFRGHRHDDCQVVAKKVLMASLEIDEEMACVIIRKSEQGFVDANNEFVSRYVALEIQLAAGIESKNPMGYVGNQLYSEDLY